MGPQATAELNGTATRELDAAEEADMLASFAGDKQTPTSTTSPTETTDVSANLTLPEASSSDTPEKIGAEVNELEAKGKPSAKKPDAWAQLSTPEGLQSATGKNRVFVDPVIIGVES